MTQLIAKYPPSYDLLFGQLKEAKSSSDGHVSFAHKGVAIISKLFVYAILLAIFVGISITDIVIGATYVDDCPAERYIPIYLIVGGCFSTVLHLCRLVQTCLKRNEGEEEGGGNNLTNAFDGLTGCFMLAWFICGNVWIYRTYDHFSTTDPTRGDYCHPTLYYFAFWELNATYIILGLSCLLFCLGFVLEFCFGKE